MTGKHFHHGKSSKDILDSKKVLNAIGLKKGDIFLDAGSGDGYMSLAASKIVGEKGKVYAVDVWEESMNILKKEIQNSEISNIEPIIADISKKIPIKDETVDICYMANVLHGFVENDNLDKVMSEIRRILRPEGIFAVVEFKKIENTPGPPMKIKINPKNVREIIEKYHLTFKNVEEVGKHHYVVITVK
ncbi:MAG: methyltransferase domain-containing protein [Methanobacterium sp.]|uniref:class I SAM-dependent methyltransferase n=1 Tax=Methanobacterium sp. TaxID=2164 RepID=UPI003D65BBC2|nr:methyltransferase domain-containing protein [Methanobacterium sp.]